MHFPRNVVFLRGIFPTRLTEWQAGCGWQSFCSGDTDKCKMIMPNNKKKTMGPAAETGRPAEAAKGSAQAAGKAAAGTAGAEAAETAGRAAEAAGSAARTAELEAALKAAEEKAAVGRDDYLRLMAEFDTFRRRTAEEKLELVAHAAADTIKGLLPVLDDCEIALAQLKDSTDSAAAKEGTELIYNKLMAYLKGKGLAVIEARGADFDTDFHEAVTQFPVEDPAQKGKVIDVVQTGYTLGGKVLRYAKVIVGA